MAICCLSPFISPCCLAPLLLCTHAPLPLEAGGDPVQAQGVYDFGDFLFADEGWREGKKVAYAFGSP